MGGTKTSRCSRVFAGKAETLEVKATKRREAAVVMLVNFIVKGIKILGGRKR